MRIIDTRFLTYCSIRHCDVKRNHKTRATPDSELANLVRRLLYEAPFSLLQDSTPGQERTAIVQSSHLDTKRRVRTTQF